MTKAESVPTSESVSDEIATYFVVPIIPFDNGTQNVLYYEPVSKVEKKWRKVSSKDLNARGQDRNANKILLLQPSVDMIVEHTDLGKDILDATVHLYAGVAKTFAVTDEFESVYPLSSDRTLIIPVAPETVRGLILVFTKASGTGKKPDAITQLIASPDPEIKNSTGGVSDGG